MAQQPCKLIFTVLVLLSSTRDFIHCSRLIFRTATRDRVFSFGGDDFPVSFDSGNQLRQSVTKLCGRTGDGQTDPFNLAAQFVGKKLDVENNNSIRTRKVLSPARIVGGSDTSATRICWQVLFVATLSNGDEQVCGGVIVGSRTILTAAHCLLNTNTRVPLAVSGFAIIVGAVDSNAPNTADPTGCQQVFTVSAAVMRPDYNDALNGNDLAVLTLNGTIDINNKVCTCTLCLNNRQPALGETCVTSGYGFERSDLSTPRFPVPLKWLSVVVATQTNRTFCPVFADGTGAQTNRTQYICAGAAGLQDPCLGDDGGPLACYDPTTNSHYLAGIYAFGSETCALGTADQFTKVANYLAWVVQTAAAGDVLISSSSSTTTAPVATTTSVSTPAPTPAPTPSPTPAPVSTTTTGAVVTSPSTERKACGLPGTGVVDPYGLAAQFAKSKELMINEQSRLMFRNPQSERFRPFPSSRIIGGTDTTATELCWQAFLVATTSAGAVTCGAVIIGSQTILTAGTCIVDLNNGGTPLLASQLSVTVGALNNAAPSSNTQDTTGCAQTFQVATAILNPAYNFGSDDNDIAILVLQSAINLNSKQCACTICLTDRQPAVNETCILSGYGFERGDLSTPRNPIPLKWVPQQVHLQGTTCPAFQDATTGATTNKTNYICSGGVAGQDQCLGDNGGPFFCFNPSTNSHYLAGIIAFGSEVCGTGTPGQSAKVANYLQWIANSSPAGDVVFNTTSVVTQATTVAPPVTTTAAPPVTTTNPPVTTTTPPVTTAASVSNCGRSGNGVADPFGLAKARLGQMQVFPTILGGQPAPAKEICWQALMIGDLGLPNGTFQYCGGVIIGSRTILTAAHCTFSLITASHLAASAITVVVGAVTFPPSADTSGCASVSTVSQVIPHPNYNDNIFNNDIAILVLPNPINFASGCACPICVTDLQPATGETCSVSGYGNEGDNAPAQATTPLSWVNIGIRQQSYDGSCYVSVDSAGTRTDLDLDICAGGVIGKDTCHGDSGGPLTCYNPATASYYVAGLTSFGTDPCGGNVGSQYTKVAAFLTFILANAPAGDVNVTVTGQVTTTLVPTVPTTVPTTIGPTVATTATIRPITTTTAAGQGNSTSTRYYPPYFNNYKGGKRGK